MDEEPKFPLMAKVRTLPPLPPHEGYVIEIRDRVELRLYKLSLQNDGVSWEKWFDEESLEQC